MACVLIQSSIIEKDSSSQKKWLAKNNGPNPWRKPHHQHGQRQTLCGVITCLGKFPLNKESIKNTNYVVIPDAKPSYKRM